jgi:hypothetical protein
VRTDAYAFRAPNDNPKVALAFDVHGFIVPRFFERPSLPSTPR